MSPEIMDNKRYNSKTDIWSLGVILYELVCLKLPFDGRSMAELVRKIVHSRPAALPSTYSQDLRGLVTSMLEKSTFARPGINAILSLGIIKNRISRFLDENQRRDEFSHTILHGQNVMSSASTRTATGAPTPNPLIAVRADKRLSNPSTLMNKYPLQGAARNQPNQEAIAAERVAAIAQRRRLEEAARSQNLHLFLVDFTH